MLCLPAFIQSGIVTHYELNKSEITLKFCVNKDKPDMACNGQCHMKKQMTKISVGLEEQRNTEHNPLAKSLTQLDWLYEMLHTDKVQNLSIDLLDNTNTYKVIALQRGYALILGPPPKHT